MEASPQLSYDCHRFAPMVEPRGMMGLSSAQVFSCPVCSIFSTNSRVKLSAHAESCLGARIPVLRLNF